MNSFLSDTSALGYGVLERTQEYILRVEGGREKDATAQVGESEGRNSK